MALPKFSPEVIAFLNSIPEREEPEELIESIEKHIRERIRDMGGDYRSGSYRALAKLIIHEVRMFPEPKSAWERLDEDKLGVEE